MLRVGVLASGEGTNFQALHDACVTGYAEAEIVCVLTDRPGAGVLERAAHSGVEGVFVDPRDAADRASYDRLLLASLKMFGVDLVCAAGFMRLLGSRFVTTYHEQILNVHPSLLPAFPGLDAIGQAWRWGVRVTGSTVHVIDAELDHGPIVFQRAVERRPDDTIETLAERVHLAEYEIYPKALRFWASTETISIDGRTVVTGDVADPPWTGGLPPALRRERDG